MSKQIPKAQDPRFIPPPWWKEYDGLFHNMMDYVSHDAKQNMIDGIACMLHNKGYSLDGNTEESDFRWFCRELYRRTNQGVGIDWDNLAPEGKAHWEQLARAAIDVIPHLMSRVSSRCILFSEVFRNMERAMREEAKGKR